MNTALRAFSWGLVLSCASGMAIGQQAPPAPMPASPAAAPTPSPSASAPKSSAQIDAGEPRANGVGSPADGASPGPVSPDGQASAPPRPAAGASAAAPAAGRSAPKTAAAAGSKGSTAADRLNLNTATVTGDREQPKVMYIVPWKSANIGDLSGKPMNSLLDEALAPVDREEFKREVAYYDAVRADAPQNGASPPAAKQGEK